MNTNKHIKLCITNKDHSQNEAALYIGINQAYGRIDSVKVKTTLSSIEKIADTLEVSVCDLFSKDKPVNINSYEKVWVEYLKGLDEQENSKHNSILTLNITAAKKTVN